MTVRLSPTWQPSYLSGLDRAGGPLDVGNLDSVLASSTAEIVDGDRRYSAPEIEALVARVAGGLRRRGVRHGDVVTWRLPNCVAGTVLFRSCWRLGAIAAPLLHSLGDADAGRAVAQVNPDCTVDASDAIIANPDALLDQFDGPRVAMGSSEVKGRDIAVVLFTSGSTGAPKAVLHTHRALAYKSALMVRIHGLGPSDAVLMPAPQAHVSGLLNGLLVPTVAGMRTVLVRRFDPAHALDLVAAERVSFMVGPPTFFVAMAGEHREAPGAGRLASMRLISSGGASVTPEFITSTSQLFGCRVKRTYGSTEAPTVATSTNDDPTERAAFSDGRAVGAVELRISNPASGRRLAAGHPGELWIRGPELFAGYVDAAATADCVVRGGWFRTGDLATVDPDGWLQIVGRIKDIVIRGGENISTAEVEGLLERHRDVLQAVCVGYPDPLMGERVAAFIVGATSFDLDECRRWFAELGVARFKTPERIIVVDHLPLLGSGKADRGALKARAALS